MPYVFLIFQPHHKEEGHESCEEGSEGDEVAEERAEGAQVEHRYQGLRGYQSKIDERFGKLYFYHCE